jgi:integrase
VLARAPLYSRLRCVETCHLEDTNIRALLHPRRQPLDFRNFATASFKPLLKKAGLPDIRFHDLRHTRATLLLSRGHHPKLVQELLGHASVAMTLNRYSHVLPGMGD